ncbi:MAG: hypothetical protein AB7K09_18800 [Planctomycetota bacterium]
MHTRHHHIVAAVLAATFILASVHVAAAQPDSPPPDQPEANGTNDANGANDLDQFMDDEGIRQPAAPASDSSSQPLAEANLGGGVKAQLLELSADFEAAAGWSSIKNPDGLEGLEGGDHDPNRLGFDIQNIELVISGAVDPFFYAQAIVVLNITLEGETNLELEEAFIRSTSLPGGLEIKAGQFLTQFGRLNASHPHTWEFIDQAVINTRLFGPDGMRGQGVQLSWTAPLPWFAGLTATMQNSQGETMASFRASEEFFDERPIGGRTFAEQSVNGLADFVYALRLLNGFNLGDEVAMQIGVSGAWGPNATGSGGETSMAGVDLVIKWNPLNQRKGTPFLTFQTEVMARRYLCDSSQAGDLRDWGFYAQVFVAVSEHVAFGVRYDYANGQADGATDAFRDTRQRGSLVVQWRFSEFARIRLQYNLDDAPHLSPDPRTVHAVWFGFEMLIGKHPAHSF